jgi:beta-phosphoglucomutase
MLKAVIFDLDGVLVSTDRLHYSAWSKLARELGITAFTEEDAVRQRGVSRMRSLEILLEKAGRTYSPEEKNALAARKNAYYIEMLDALTPGSPLAGVRETLTMLKARGVLLAIGSASRNTPVILEKCGIAGFFDAVADGRDVQRSKPDPQVFLMAAQKLGVPPASCLVVEDADAGIEAACAAGMKSLGVGPAQRNLLADFHAESLADATLEWDEMMDTTRWNTGQRR